VRVVNSSLADERHSWLIVHWRRFILYSVKVVKYLQ